MLREKLYSVLKKIIPQKMLEVVVQTLNYKITPQRLFNILKNTNLETRVCFNSGVRKVGYATVGYAERCDILLKKGRNIKIVKPDNSVDKIVIDEFLEEVADDGVLVDLFYECARLLKPNKEINIIYKDSKQILKEITQKNYNQDKYLHLSKRRNVFSDFVVKVNKAFFVNRLPRRFLDAESIKRLLVQTGFDVIRKYPTKFPNSCIIAKKSAKKSKLATLAKNLPKNARNVTKDVPIYFSDCDSLNILDNFKKIKIDKLQHRKFASVIGSQYFINLLPILKPQKVLLFDINNFQVRYLQMLIEIVKSSSDFNEFAERLFSRPYNQNKEKFLKQKYSKRIFNETKNIVSDKYIFKNSIKKIAEGEFVKLGSVLPVLRIRNNTMCQSLTILDHEYFRPGPEINVLYTHGGMAKNFDYVKNILLKAEIVRAKLEDRKIQDFLDENSILYVSNIGETDWIYDDFTDFSLLKIDKLARKSNLTSSFRKQWKESVIGFRKFMSNVSKNFWIIDAMGNLFNSSELLLERSDSHQWLWQKVKPLIIGNCIELIHKKDNTWGFNEHLKTVNIQKYTRDFIRKRFDTVIFHILLGNGVDIESFSRAVEIASKTSKRIIIIEHDRDSENFGPYSAPNVPDIRFLISIIRAKIHPFVAEVKVSWSGASKRVDERKHLTRANLNRNIIITLDF